MRLFELLLTLEVIISLFLFFREKRNVKSINILAIITIITFALHYFIEGIRWQLYFIYLICIIIILFNLTKGKINKKWLRNILLISSLLIVVFSSTLAIILPVFKLPEMHSKFSVGTDYMTFKDKERDNRIINVKVWYPTSAHDGVNDLYCQNPIESLNGLMGMPGFVFGHLILVKTGAFYKSDILNTTNKYPLIIYLHGAVSTNVDNTELLQELAGNGYIVMAIDFKFSYESYHLNKSEATTMNFESQMRFSASLFQKVVPNQVEDILFCINEMQTKKYRLSDYIDFSKISLIGHSLGGSTAINASLENKNIAAVVNIDGPIDKDAILRFHSPLLYISSYSPDLSDEKLTNKGLPDTHFYRDVKNFELKNVRQIFNKNQDQSHWVRFKNAGHLDFTDLAFVIPLMKTKGYDKTKGDSLKTVMILDFLDCSLNKTKIFNKIKNNSIEWIK